MGCERGLEDRTQCSFAGELCSCGDESHDDTWTANRFRAPSPSGWRRPRQPGRHRRRHSRTGRREGATTPGPVRRSQARPLPQEFFRHSCAGSSTRLPAGCSVWPPSAGWCSNRSGTRVRSFCSPSWLCGVPGGWGGGWRWSRWSCWPPSWRQRARRDGRADGSCVALAALLFPLVPALSGHALAQESIRSFMVLNHALHFAGDGAWIGGPLLVLVVGLPAAREADVPAQLAGGLPPCAAPVACFS